MGETAVKLVDQDGNVIMSKAEADEIRTLVTDLQKRLVRFAEKPADKDAIREEMYERMKKDILAELHPQIVVPQKKMIFTQNIDEVKEGEIQVGFGTFLEMVKRNSPELSPLTLKVVNGKTVMSGLSNAQGGYTIPEGYATEIIGKLNDVPTVSPLFTTWTQSERTQNLPKWLTDLTIYWVDEDGDKTLTKPTLARLQMIIKKMAAIVPFTDEYIDDSNVDMVAKIKELIAENMGGEIERIGLVGNTGAGDPFMGILYAVGVNAVPQVGANLNYSDFTAVQNNTGVMEAYRKNPIWVMNRYGINLAMDLLDNSNRPLWRIDSPEKGRPGTILGDPYKISDKIPTAAGVTSILYGDMKYVLIGQLDAGRNNLAVTVSQSAVAPNPTPTMNAYIQDETWLRFVLRRGELVSIPEAYVKLTGAK